MLTEDKVEVVKEVCMLISEGRFSSASNRVNERYPFVPTQKSGRQYTPRQMTGIFVRDGFIDRYKGGRLIFPPTLRLISHLLPGEFPYHKNGKMTEGHIAYWELFPTIDHILPVALGGSDTVDNWVCCSMLTNCIKSNWTLEQLRWNLLPPGDFAAWDGLLKWFVENIRANRRFLEVQYFKRWYGAALEYAA